MIKTAVLGDEYSRLPTLESLCVLENTNSRFTDYVKLYLV